MLDAPPSGEMPELEERGTGQEEIAELQKKLASVTKSYDDIRPQYDRTYSASQKKESENQELRARLAVIERENELNQAAKVNKDEDELSEDDLRVIEDFPEVMRTSERIAGRIVKRQMTEFKRQQEENVDKRISRYVEDKYDVPINDLTQKFESMNRQSYFDGQLGFGIWPQIEEDQSFIDWVNKDSMYRTAMTTGDNETKVRVIKIFLDGQGGQMYGGQDPQDQRRFQASQLLGGSQSHTGPADPTQGLSGEALFDALPE
ncbi:MAG: hypothetical protein HN726_04715 [Candidatus Magasanikbacteria bacterium]|jgi:hypothetical protein|nr:hypothetical protein [Candidatus Magasanikbacteria bacterium]